MEKPDATSGKVKTSWLRSKVYLQWREVIILQKDVIYMRT